MATEQRQRLRRPPFVLLALSSLLLVACCSFQAAVGQQQPQQRVRKELRSLSKKEVQLFVKAINTMISTPTEVGQQLYGDAYKDFRYFVIKHAVTANDPRGDQGHGAPCFMTFHRAFLLEIERAVLSVVPDLKAIPYWDMARDTRGGDISRFSRNYIFSSQWFGSLDGKPSQGYAVTNGLFPRQPVLPYAAPAGHEATMAIFNGSLSTGLLRDDSDDNTSPYVSRMPAADMIASYDGTPEHGLYFVPNPKPNEYPLNYRASDWWFCTNASNIVDWMDWSTCADVATLYNSGAAENDVVNLMRTTRAPLLHPAPHWLIGGVTDDLTGDFTEVAASPNDFAVFIAHHSNIDRQNMIWQANALTLDPSAADNSWGYPASVDDYPNGWQGCWLDDVVTANFPFTDVFPGVQPSDDAGFTHADVLALTAPGVGPYTYDRMTPSATQAAAAGRRLLGAAEAPSPAVKWPKFYKKQQPEEGGHLRRKAQEQQDYSSDGSRSHVEASRVTAHTFARHRMMKSARK